MLQAKAMSKGVRPKLHKAALGSSDAEKMLGIKHDHAADSVRLATASHNASTAVKSHTRSHFLAYYASSLRKQNV